MEGKNEKAVLKRIICALLVAVMAIGMLPTFAFAASKTPFIDVKSKSWYSDEVAYVYEKGLMYGVTDTSFDPNGITTRAMVVGVLHRLEGSPEVASKGFNDVKKGRWYYKSVMWAQKNNIVAGYTDTEFGPNNPMTREEMVAVFYRYAKFKGYDVTKTANANFTDFNKTHSYAKTAVKWAVAAGLISGFSDNTVQPRANSTRAQMATVLKSFDEMLNKPVVVPPVTDNNQSTYSVVFESNGGSAVASQAVKSGGKATKPANPTRQDFEFQGWYTDNQTFKNEYNFSSAVTGDVKLYAKWKPLFKGSSSGYESSVTEYSISALEVDKNTGEAKAIVSAPQNCALVIKFIYEERFFSDMSRTYISDGNLYGSHVVREGANMEPVYAQINGELPDYFVAEAVLVDENGNELCAPYVSVNNTKRYEEYDEKTVYDFPEDKLVLNFDESTDNNFGVLADDVKVLSSNDVEFKDEDGDGAGDYYHVDTPSLIISKNDKIYISDGEDYFIFKALSVTKNGNIYKIVPASSKDETAGYELTDFYKFIKVDMEYDSEQAAATYTQPRQNLRGASPNSNLNGAGLNIVNISSYGEGEASLLLEVPKFQKGAFDISASANVTVKATMVFEWDVVLFGEDYLKNEFICSLETKANLTAELREDEEDNADENGRLASKLSGGDEITLAKVAIPMNVPGFTVYGELGFSYSWSTDARFVADISSTKQFGYKYTLKDGYQKIESKNTSWEVNCYGSIEFKFGPTVAIGVDFLDDVIDCSLSVSVFCVVKGEVQILPSVNSADKVHACHLCLNASVNIDYEVKLTMEYYITRSVNGKPIDETLLSGSFPAGELYASILNKTDSTFGGHPHIGKGECPNYIYKIAFSAVNKDNQAVNVTVNVHNEERGSDYSVNSGSHKYLYPCKYTATATIDGQLCKTEFTVAESAKTVVLKPDKKQSTVSGSVVDSDDSTTIVGATVTVMQGETVITSASTDVDGNFLLNLESGSYTIEASAEGYVSATQNITIDEETDHYSEMFRLTKEDEDELMGGIFGEIKDAITGDTVSGVRLRIVKGWSQTAEDNTVVATVYTDSYGDYEYLMKTVHGVNFGIPAGNYTVLIDKEGYISKSFNVTIDGGENNLFNNIITPVGAENIYTVTLSWGKYPYDLDSHLNATIDSNREHIYYWDDYGYNGNLDVDDTDSYGPETITVYDISSYDNGFSYSVHDYTNRSSSDSNKLALSGATVTVYKGGNLLKIYSVPNVSGTVWNVFSIDSNGNITSNNTFSYVENPRNVYGY